MKAVLLAAILLTGCGHRIATSIPRNTSNISCRVCWIGPYTGDIYCGALQEFRAASAWAQVSAKTVDTHMTCIPKRP